MIHFVYIIYSQSVNRFYVGQTINPSKRLEQHKSHFYKNSSTKIADDWELFLVIECISKKQALKLEQFIKNMKNRKFYIKLKENPEIIKELLNRFND